MNWLKRVVVGIWIVGLSTFIFAIAHAGVGVENAGVSPGDIQQLHSSFGLPGLLGGIGIAAIAAFRKIAPQYWNKLPRWARFLLGFVASGGPPVVSSLVSGTPLGEALVTGAQVGLGSIGIAEALKTALSPRAQRFIDTRG